MSKSNIKYLFWRLYHHKFFILFIALLLSFIMMLFSLFLVKKEYTSSTTSYLSLNSNQRSTTALEFDHRKKIAKRYEKTFEKNSVYKDVIKQLNLDTNVSDLQDDVAIKTNSTVGTATIIAKSENPQSASDIANAVRERVNQDIKSSKVLEKAVARSEIASPNTVRNTLLTFFISSVLVSIFVLLYSILKMRVSTASDVKELLDVELLGNIPNVKL